MTIGAARPLFHALALLLVVCHTVFTGGDPTPSAYKAALKNGSSDHRRFFF